MASTILYHFAFDPGSRAVRLALGEAKVAFDETPCRPWEPDCPLHALNPSGMPPVVQTSIQGKSVTLCEPAAILGWLEDQSKDIVVKSGVEVITVDKAPFQAAMKPLYQKYLPDPKMQDMLRRIQETK